MTAADWFGVAVALLGTVLLLDVRGFTRGASELLTDLKRRGGALLVAGPTTVWGLRLFGAALVVFGACIVVAADPS